PLANLVLQNLPVNGNSVPDTVTSINDLKTALAELMGSLADIKSENLSPEQKIVTDRLLAQIREIEQLIDEADGAVIQLSTWFVNDILNNVRELQESGVLSPQQQGITRQVNTPPAVAIDEDDGQHAQAADDLQARPSVPGETRFGRLENIIQGLVPVPQQNAGVKSEPVISDLLKVFQPSPQAKSGDVLIGNPAGLPSQIYNPAGDGALASLPVNSAFNQPGWGEEIGERIRWLVNHNIQTAELRLNPPHLGPIEIRVSLQNDQMNVMFTSHHAAVREALESAMPRLREMFGNSGLELTNVDISQHSFSDQRRASTDGSAIHYYGSGAEEDQDLSEISEIQQRIYVSQGLVDYYA
ncbi:MAG TPA: flagellar hook-length control protein FliK, partial [Gammaproteobacteria bacterium]